MTATMRVIWPFLRRQWRALAIASVATVVIALAEVLRPFPLKFVIDHIFGAAKSGHLNLDASDIALAFGVAGLVLAIALVEAAGGYFVDVHLERAGERIIHDLRVAIYAHLQRLSLRFHQQRHTGDLVTRLTGDVSAVGSIFSQSAGTLAASTLTLVGMVVVGFLIDPFLAVIAFATTPLIGIVALRFRRRMGTLQRRQRKMEGEIASLATEALSSIEQVKALGAEDYEHERLARKSEERRAAGYEATLVEGQFTRLIDIVGAIATAVVLIVAVFRVSAGAISPGDVVVMVTYVRRVYKPLRDVAREWVRFSRSMARAERVAEVLSADEMLEERASAVRRGRAEGALEFEAVSFGYRPDRPALVDVTLSIPAGQRLALVGRSGAGKSTLLALAARFYDPTSGRVRIDGVDARDVPLADLREQVGLVLQDAVLFTGTVAENISWGIDADRTAVIRAAEAVGADEFIRGLPDGYDAQLDPAGTGLSGGQRQRVAIARTLLRNPAVLLLDEPTTGLDSVSEQQVMAGLDVLMAGRTTIIVTHAPELARRADRVAMLLDGRLTRHGLPEQVLPYLAAGGDGQVGANASATGVSHRPPPFAVLPKPPRLTDPALPALGTLLDTGAVAPLLQRSFNGGTPLDVRVRYLRYKPNTNVVVQYAVVANGMPHEAVAMLAADGLLAHRAAKRRNTLLAQAVGDRAGAAVPLAYESDVDALIQWYPVDLWLPALAWSGPEFQRALHSAALDGASAGSEPERLAYKPRRRAVLAIDEHVVRLYARPDEFERAVVGQRAMSRVSSVPTPRLEAILADQRMTVQTRLSGTRVSDPMAAAEHAGALLAALHSDRVGQLPAFGPAEQLAATAACAQLLGRLAPDLRDRLDRLIARVASSRPADVELVTAHGDFHAGQLLELGSDLAMTDFDELCLAPAALDAATYAADLVRGEDGDLAKARAAVAAVQAGYGTALAGLDWYLATMIVRNAPWPFRYFVADWPARLAANVRAAEEVLDAA